VKINEVVTEGILGSIASGLKSAGSAIKSGYNKATTSELVRQATGGMAGKSASQVAYNMQDEKEKRIQKAEKDKEKKKAEDAKKRKKAVEKKAAELGISVAEYSRLASSGQLNAFIANNMNKGGPAVVRPGSSRRPE
jgi:hypothetical protein